MRIVQIPTGAVLVLMLASPTVYAGERGGSHATHAPVKTTGGKATSHGSGPKGDHGPKSGGHTKTSTKTSTSASGTTTTASGTTTTSTSNPIADKIEARPQLAERLKALLPANTTLAKASDGFKNQGQFIAALHVSKNLGIDFDKLKASMTEGNSLGQSIHTLRPEADANHEAKRAETEANHDLAPTTTKK